MKLEQKTLKQPDTILTRELGTNETKEIRNIKRDRNVKTLPIHDTGLPSHVGFM